MYCRIYLPLSINDVSVGPFVSSCNRCKACYFRTMFGEKESDFFGI